MTKSKGKEIAQSDTDNSISELYKQLESEKEAKLQVLADFDNYKKRIAKEREEFNLLGNASILSILLEIQTDLNRAIAEISDAPIGLTMIKDKINNFLTEQDIEEIVVSVDDKFEPQYMEAIGAVVVNEEDKIGKVVHVDRNAYKLKTKDMLIQTARVIVGKKGQI